MMWSQAVVPEGPKVTNEGAGIDAVVAEAKPG